MNYESVSPAVRNHLDCIQRVYDFYSYNTIVTKYLRDKVVVTAISSHTSTRVGITVHYGPLNQTLYAGNGRIYRDNTALEFHNFEPYLFYNPL